MFKAYSVDPESYTNHTRDIVEFHDRLFMWRNIQISVPETVVNRVHSIIPTDLAYLF